MVAAGVPGSLLSAASLVMYVCILYNRFGELPRRLLELSALLAIAAVSSLGVYGCASWPCIRR